MKKILLSLLLLTAVALQGCFSIARTDTNTDQSFGDPISKIGESMTPEQANDLQGKTLTGPEVSLFGGNLAIGIFRWAKGVTDQYSGTEFTHGSAAFSTSAASAVEGRTKYRRGKERVFGAGEIKTEAHTEKFFDGMTSLTESYLKATPAGQALMAKDVVTKSDIDAVLTDSNMSPDVRKELESFRNKAPGSN